MAPLFSRAAVLGTGRVAVLGTGLIGGSFALAARRALPGIRIAGWDKPSVLERALELGVVDEASPELQEAVKGADLVYIALPVGLAIERLPEIARHVPGRALVTDACSTKRAICAAAEKCFSEDVLFLGGHPMAGSEVSGIDGADAALFQGAKYALVGTAVEGASGVEPGPISGDDISGDRISQDISQEKTGRIEQGDARIANFVRLIEAIGARPIWIDAEAHDRAAAFVSHLPQLVSIALAGVTREATDQTGLPLTLAGRGLRDALRLAGSPYSVWRDIVLTNTDNLDTALDRLVQAIEHLRAHLRQRELEEEFSAANDVYKLLHNLS
jgi:prephenate dehydrogenase